MRFLLVGGMKINVFIFWTKSAQTGCPSAGMKEKKNNIFFFWCWKKQWPNAKGKELGSGFIKVTRGQGVFVPHIFVKQFCFHLTKK